MKKQLDTAKLFSYDKNKMNNGGTNELVKPQIEQSLQQQKQQEKLAQQVEELNKNAKIDIKILDVTHKNAQPRGC